MALRVVTNMKSHLWWEAERNPFCATAPTARVALLEHEQKCPLLFRSDHGSVMKASPFTSVGTEIPGNCEVKPEMNGCGGTRCMPCLPPESRLSMGMLLSWGPMQFLSSLAAYRHSNVIWMATADSTAHFRLHLAIREISVPASRKRRVGDPWLAYEVR